MFEKLKTTLLLLLVINSLFLTGLLIFYSPNSTNGSLSEYLPRVRLGQDMEYEKVLKPRTVIFHSGDNSHFLTRPNSYPYNMIMDEINHLSFYDFNRLNKKVDWKVLIEEKEGIEIVFPTPLSDSLLVTKYNILNTEGALSQITRLWIFNEDNNVKTYFISDIEDTIYVSQTSISAQKLQQLLAGASAKISYTHYFPNPKNENVVVLKPFYLPNEHVLMKSIKKSYTTISIGDFIQLLFIDPSVVKRVDVDNKNNILYTDGNRSLQLNAEDKYISYYQPVYEQRETIPLSKDIYAAIRFVNQHGGWDGEYYLDDITKTSTNQALLEFSQYVEGYQLIDRNGHYGKINLQLTDGIVSSFQRSMVILDKYVEIEILKTKTHEELISYLKTQELTIDQLDSVDLVYVTEEDEETGVSLQPNWRIEVQEKGTLYIPVEESVVQ